MDVFHVFQNCTNGTKSCKTSHVVKAFELGNIQRHPNDQNWVLSWIQEWEEIEENPIIYYKLQGQLREEVTLEKGDFVVITQTEFQKHLVQKFGGKNMCWDTTYGTTCYDIELNSLLLLNEFEEGVPVIFCLNTDNFAFMHLFFSKIRDNTSAISPC